MDDALSLGANEDRVDFGFSDLGAGCEQRNRRDGPGQSHQIAPWRATVAAHAGKAPDAFDHLPSRFGRSRSGAHGSVPVDLGQRSSGRNRNHKPGKWNLRQAYQRLAYAHGHLLHKDGIQVGAGQSFPNGVNHLRNGGCQCRGIGETDADCAHFGLVREVPGNELCHDGETQRERRGESASGGEYYLPWPRDPQRTKVWACLDLFRMPGSADATRAVALFGTRASGGAPGHCRWL